MQGGQIRGEELSVHDAAGHMVILGAAAVAAFVLSVAIAPERSPTPADEVALVVALPQRPSEPVAKISTSQPLPGVSPPSGGPGSVARQLQSELKRVGCYDGEINGIWTTSSRFAMKTFTDLVNAKLPIGKPDHILLALVQGHKERVCGASQVAADKPGAGEIRPARTPTSPATELPAVIAATPRLISPPTEAIRPTAPPRADRRAPVPVDDLQSPPGSAQPLEPGTSHPDAPIPSVGVYDGRPRQSSRRTPSQQIAYARSLFRSLKRAVASALPLP
jgi:hypothetical protein